jgi:hypothetical protein
MREPGRHQAGRGFSPPPLCMKLAIEATRLCFCFQIWAYRLCAVQANP